jgi:2-methylfumaryl-CoA isomerase
MDYAVNPRFGVPMLTRPLDVDRPVNHVLPAWDIATGLLAVSGLLAGLRRRTVDGRGSRIDVALADVAAAHVAHLGWLAEVAERGQDRPRLGNHLFGAFGVDFVCADGRRIIAVAITRQQWRDLVRMTGTEAVFASLASVHGADFEVEGERFENRGLIEAVLAPWFARRTAAEVIAAAKDTRVMIGDFRSVSEVVQSYRRGAESAVLTEVDQAGFGPMLTATSPLRWNTSYAEAAPAPRFGADTEWALAELLGLSGREIAALVDSGSVMAAPSPTRSAPERRDLHAPV